MERFISKKSLIRSKSNLYQAYTIFVVTKYFEKVVSKGS